MALKNNKMFISLVVLAFVYFIFFYKWDVKEAVAYYADVNCQVNKDCLIDLHKITPFDWDRAYIFQSGETRENIRDAIGVNFLYMIDVGVKYIFIKDNKIVYFEEYFPDMDYRDKNQVTPKFASYLLKGDYPSYYFLTKDNSQLLIKIRGDLQRKNNTFYEISPSNKNQFEKYNTYKKIVTSIY
ncbi:conserved hypothetical protein [Xenorhabdus bovienii str. oregonense]|uniref:Uncharacterized protein n=1 Tax=Xenorhabdus bovienii str. oregonense TaxID=1398202 RepID=A0A077P2R2_XENBV|nr:hypothetical protein [Xenorhabdus bovienii]CDH04988.1 conserved hypothetical protein [Xenorhabdus bovienii str. oregonense]